MPPRTAEIKVTVELNDQNLPTGIAWQATEGQEEGETACQAMMLSFWDSEKQAVAAIDLWTEEMSIEEMNQYFYQVIHKLADTYLRATKDDAIARETTPSAKDLAKRQALLGAENKVNERINPTCVKVSANGSPHCGGCGRWDFHRLLYRFLGHRQSRYRLPNSPSHLATKFMQAITTFRANIVIRKHGARHQRAYPV